MGYHMDSPKNGTCERTVILCPPAEVTPTDDVLEDEPDNRPWYVVDSSCRWNGARSGEDDREAVEIGKPIGQDDHAVES